MALEKCPQCEAEISDKAPKCVHCGWERPVEEPEPKPRYCEECGKAIEDEEAEVCPNCGCPVKKEDQEAAEDAPAKVEVTSVKVNKKTRKIVIGVVAAVVALVCVVGCVSLVQSSNAEEQAKNEYNTYVDNLKSASAKMLDGAAKAESTCNMVNDIWGDAINKKWDSKTSKYKASDFNTAISNYYSSTEGKNAVSYIKSNQSEVDELMKKLKNPPDGMANAYTAVSEYYDAYSKLASLAISPTGNYSNYGNSFGDADDKAISCYKKLETQIPDKK